MTPREPELDAAGRERLRREWALALAHSSAYVRPIRPWAPTFVLRRHAQLRHKLCCMREAGHPLANPYGIAAVGFGAAVMLCVLVAALLGMRS